MKLPYTYVRCPCADVTTSASAAYESQRDEDEEDQERTFNPRSRRANYSLYPLEQLNYCEDCHLIRCPKCTIEEVACWYCPSCLFEIPSSTVKSEGSRCTRNCFNCPVCAAPMSVNTLDSEKSSIIHGPWILACGYCNWTSLDIGVQFEKAMNLYGQISKLKGRDAPQPRSPSHRDATKDQAADSEPSSDPDAIFASLKSFYKSQLSVSTASNPLLTPAGELNYNSPSSLARLMSLYAGIGSYGKKSNAKSKDMRESATQAEGLCLVDPVPDTEAIHKLRTQGWSGTASIVQQAEQIRPRRFIDDLLPVPTLLRTKRNKRCGNCRHILVKPESKVQSTRFRIKLVAINNIPKFTLKALSSPQHPAIDLNSLLPNKPNQFLLTIRNAMYDPVHITLATPTRTPGLHQHKVTILCPQFDLGANTDVWDEALKDDARANPHGRLSKLANPPATDSGGGGENKVAEAGKVWERGRDWTTIVVEVVCADIGQANDDDERERRGLEEDEDVLEIPIFVRMDWMGDDGGDENGCSPVRVLVKRELAFWVVVGVGRVVTGGTVHTEGKDRR